MLHSVQRLEQRRVLKYGLSVANEVKKGDALLELLCGKGQWKYLQLDNADCKKKETFLQKKKSAAQYSCSETLN